MSNYSLGVNYVKPDSMLQRSTSVMATDNGCVEIAKTISPAAGCSGGRTEVGRNGLPEGLACQQAISVSSQSRKARIFGTLRRAWG